MVKKLENNSAQSIYIHIPFCKRKCNYCAFVSFTNYFDYEEAYIKSLCTEISKCNFDNNIRTIYLGGGTPNLLSIKSLEKLFETLHANFNICPNAEITMEFNPKISDLNYIKAVKELGINRISLGVQSFNENILKTLNRIHCANDAIITIENIKAAGFENFSIDLMYGIFGQTIEMLKKDLEIIKTLNLPHISTYGLKIEENTPFDKFDKDNLPNEELCEQMYLLISDKLQEIGFKHYEISNFAKHNLQSQHNLTYWRNQEYYGFGVGAHGYLNKIRYKKTEVLQNYIKNPLEYEVLNVNSIEDILEEKIFLGLRLAEGIDLKEIKNNFSVDLYENKKQTIETFISNGYINMQEHKLSLTTKGFLLSNYIIGELLS